MSKILDLRQVGRPTLTIIFPVEGEELVVHVCAPTVALVDELRLGLDALSKVLNGEEGEHATKMAVYDLAAKLINCNTDGFKTDARELATKYHMSLETLAVFFDNYVEFIDIIQNEKN